MLEKSMKVIAVVVMMGLLLVPASLLAAGDPEAGAMTQLDPGEKHWYTLTVQGNGEVQEVSECVDHEQSDNRNDERDIDEGVALLRGLPSDLPDHSPDLLLLSAEILEFLHERGRVYVVSVVFQFGCHSHLLFTSILSRAAVRP